jgi:hypothetical protein
MAMHVQLVDGALVTCHNWPLAVTSASQSNVSRTQFAVEVGRMAFMAGDD